MTIGEHPSKSAGTKNDVLRWGQRVQEFDYIIVGGGSAGCVLAERLTACGRYSVLLLEAGPSDRRFWVRVPIGYGILFHQRAVNWMYSSDPEPHLGAGKSIIRGARSLAGPARSTRLSIIAGIQAITTTGPKPAIRVGTMPPSRHLSTGSKPRLPTAARRV